MQNDHKDDSEHGGRCFVVAELMSFLSVSANQPNVIKNVTVCGGPEKYLKPFLMELNSMLFKTTDPGQSEASIFCGDDGDICIST